MHRLTAGIKGDIKKRLTVLCLFIDFEKAFDSVWKQGLVVKLWNVGVHGCYLETINSFLFDREVCLLINGFMGPIRSCLDIGLPQGAALSPLLFRFYLVDIDMICLTIKQIKAFKFADDGTLKVTGKTLEECLNFLELALGAINEWTAKWRMVINCDINKTEVICFNCTDKENLPTSFKIGNKSIALVDSTKVLGILLDSKLNFREHSTYVYNKLIYRWINICRVCNRNWGLNHTVLVTISKTVMFSILFYGGIIWMTENNMSEIERLWGKIAKTAVGAIFNVNHSILEVILGVPPLQIQNQVYKIKHYLKAITVETGSSNYLKFIVAECRNNNPVVSNNIRTVFKFLDWRIHGIRNKFSASDCDIINNRDIDSFGMLSASCCIYTKKMMTDYTESIWQESVERRQQLLGDSRIPNVSHSLIPLPKNTNRKTEVKVLSMFYKNNLLNAFLYLAQRSNCPTPLCDCNTEEQTAFHILTSCPLVNRDIQSVVRRIVARMNGERNFSDVTADFISILNCSRDSEFIMKCIELVNDNNPNLRSEYKIVRQSYR